MLQKKIKSQSFIKFFMPCIISAFIAFELFFIYSQNVPKITLNTPLQIQNYSKTIIEKCETSRYKPLCYDKEIPKLMDKPYYLSMEEAFAVTKLIQNKEPKYLYCHVLGHELSSKETKKDLTKWKDVITRCPATMCNNGCLHGSMMERFRTDFLTDSQIEKIKPEFLDICEPRGSWNPTEVERSMCYHAIGHLNMYITNANIQKSLELCEYEGKKSDGRSYVQTCTQGVFMQIFQPLEPEDVALVKKIVPTKDTVKTFCDSYVDEIRGACFRESWPLFRDDIQFPDGLVKFCSYTDDPIEIDKCYSSVLSMLTVFFVIDNNNRLQLETYCNTLPKNQTENCFGNASRRLLQIDPKYAKESIELCNFVKDSEQASCYKALSEFATTTFHTNSDEFEKFCSLFPNKYKANCTTYIN